MYGGIAPLEGGDWVRTPPPPPPGLPWVSQVRQVISVVRHGAHPGSRTRGAAVTGVARFDHARAAVRLAYR